VTDLPSSQILRASSRFLARHVSQVGVVSGHLFAFLPSGVRPAIIPCGVDTQCFRPVPKNQAGVRLGLNRNKRFVLFRADPDNPVKRLGFADAVVNHLARETRGETITLGGVPHKNVPLYINARDAIRLRSKHEGSPTVIKEALACNLPMMWLPVGDVPERIAGGGLRRLRVGDVAGGRRRACHGSQEERSQWRPGGSQELRPPRDHAEQSSGFTVLPLLTHALGTARLHSRQS